MLAIVDHHSTPAGVPAISRGLSEATPPVRKSRIRPHPGGVPASVTVESSADSRVHVSSSIGHSVPNLLRPLRGRLSICGKRATGGVAALDPRLIAATPSGVGQTPGATTRALQSEAGRSMSTDILTPDTTEVGSYFVANYPPFSQWKRKLLPEFLAALDSPAPPPGDPLGLYLHIPFCRKRCKFCYLPRLHRQEREASNATCRRSLTRSSSERAAGGRRPQAQLRLLRRRHSVLSERSQLQSLRDRLQASCRGTTPRKSPSSASRAR